MRVRWLRIEKFRGVNEGTVLFPPRALLVGENNVGKSTVCEALELVLGPERLFRRPVVDEHDFFGGRYLDEEKISVEIRITVVLIDLSDEARIRFRYHLRRWHDEEFRFFDEPTERAGEAEAIVPEESDDEAVCWALPLLFIGRYDPLEDDFEGGTFFAHPFREPEDDDEDSGRLGAGLSRFGREEKRLCGFVFLRTLRTGSRALSFQRGSLLDTLLRLGGEGFEGLWEDTLQKIRDLDPAVGEIPQLKAIRDAIEERINLFVPLDRDEATAFFASELTRTHLREAVKFFAASEKSGHLLPFNRLGTGSINMLVFALLTFIAELKGEGSAIFAMEEPEIALPPHTQRRVIRFAQEKMGQTIVTSHSPYVIERFDPAEIVMLERNLDGALSGAPIDTSTVKSKTIKSDRRQFAEAVLARAVLVVEGSTEVSVFSATADALERFRQPNSYVHPDLAGLTFFDARGDGAVPRFGPVFQALGKKAFGLQDKQNSEQTSEAAAMLAAYDDCWESRFSKIEDLLVAEVPVSVLRKFLTNSADWSDYPREPKYEESMTDEEVQDLARRVLWARKGDAHAYGGRLISFCSSLEELPTSVAGILLHIHEKMNPAAPAEPLGDSTV